MKQFIVLLLLLLPLSFLSGQVTLNVPGDYITIQAAINAADSGDLVLVADGIYYENINFKGKAITVASHFINDPDTSHITHTIIDGSLPSNPDSGSVVIFKTGEDTSSILYGFTITGGTGTSFPDIKAGGGIIVFNSGAKIINNIIESNTLSNVIETVGGGIISFFSNVIIKNNIIQNNSCSGTVYAIGGGILLRANNYALISNNIIQCNNISAGSASGGGIDCYGPIGEVCIVSNYIKGNSVQTSNYGGGGLDIYNCSTNTPVVKNNIIIGNHSSAYGGGIFVDLDLDNSFKPGLNQHQSTLPYSDDLSIQYLTNNTLYNNSAGVSGGGIYTADMTSNITNCTFWGNTAPSNPQITGTVDITYSNVEGGWSGTGNIDIDPEFSDSTYFCLGGTSQCIDAGNPDPMYNDVEHIFNPGYAMPPALDSLRNDMGHMGGPNSLWCHWNWPFTIALPLVPILISPSIGDTINLPQVTFNWEESNPMILRYWFELDTTDQFSNYFIDSVVVGNSLEYTSLEPNRNYYWKVKAYNTTGWSDFSNVWTFNTYTFTSVEDENQLPVEFSLEQNYPNPFNPVTNIKYSIPVESEVRLIVYNTLGEQVAVLVNEIKRVGCYEVKFEAATLTSGIYYYRIHAGDFAETKKVVLLK